jgi:hypothetical protein
MMRIFCSVSDISYLNKVLTLYFSLEKTQKNEFCLNVLCLDDEIFHFFNESSLKNIKAHHIRDLENSNFLLKYFKDNNVPCSEAISNAGSQNKDPKYVQFCWALAPYFCWHLLENLKYNDVLYIDSDLYFYQDVKPIYDEIKDKSIGIIRHRIDYIESAGEYNVGIIYFKNDYVGRKCSTWWKNVLLNPANQYAKKYGGCGDQKYLELFIPLFGKNNVCVIDDSIGHLAPWNVTFHKYENSKLIWNDNVQELFFFHFAHFVPDFKNDSYRTSYRNEWIWGHPEKVNPYTKNFYDQYFAECKKSNTVIESYHERIKKC